MFVAFLPRFLHAFLFIFKSLCRKRLLKMCDLDLNVTEFIGVTEVSGNGNSDEFLEHSWKKVSFFYFLKYSLAIAIFL